MDQQLILRITAYGYKNRKFTLLDVRQALSLTSDEYKFLARHLVLKSRTEHASPNHIIGVLTFVKRHKTSESAEDQTRSIDFANDHYDFERSTYMLLSSAFFSYIDHLEIVEARKNAKSAKLSAFWAIVVSMLALIIGVASLYLQYKQSETPSSNINVQHHEPNERIK